MTPITTGKESGLALEKCQEMMRHVAQWKKAGRHIHDQGYYQRGRPLYVAPADKGHRGHCDIYYLGVDEEIHTLCYNTSPRRASRLLLALLDKSIHSIDPAIIENYSKNGYSTRCGLKRAQNKKEEEIARMRVIARSHADYMGAETGDSAADHAARVRMRREAMKDEA